MILNRLHVVPQNTINGATYGLFHKIETKIRHFKMGDQKQSHFLEGLKIYLTQNKITQS